MATRILRAAALAVAFVLATATAARADEKLAGTITRIDVAADKKSAIAVVKDDQTAALVPVTVQDDVTLRKLERAQIQVGDEIKVKYDKKAGKNVATYFKKPGGCS